MVRFSLMKLISAFSDGTNWAVRFTAFVIDVLIRSAKTYFIYDIILRVS
jgi:hypothetical protein